MTLFAVLFEDEADRAEELRRRHLPAHLEFLRRNAAFVRAAGPLSEPEGTAAGGLWLIEADGAEQVWRLVRDDPFWPTGLRRSVRVLAWTQVFATGT